VASDFGENGGQCTAAKGLFENPEDFRRAAATDNDELCGIEAEAFEPGSVGMACLVEGTGLADQQERTMVARPETGEEGNGEAGGGD